MPYFDGLSAVGLAIQAGLELAFIFVSGTLGEDVAIESLKQGATDYVLKDRLGRLGSSVRRALQEVEERNERRRAGGGNPKVRGGMGRRVRGRNAQLGGTKRELGGFRPPFSPHPRGPIRKSWWVPENPARRIRAAPERPGPEIPPGHR